MGINWYAAAAIFSWIFTVWMYKKYEDVAKELIELLDLVKEIQTGNLSHHQQLEKILEYTRKHGE